LGMLNDLLIINYDICCTLKLRIKILIIIGNFEKVEDVVEMTDYIIKMLAYYYLF